MRRTRKGLGDPPREVVTYGIATEGSVINVDDWPEGGAYLAIGVEVELPVFVRVFQAKSGGIQWGLTVDHGLKGAF